MRRALVVVALLAACLGIGMFRAYFHEQEPTVHWDYRLDREAALSTARDQAKRLGADVTNWHPSIDLDYNQHLHYWWAHSPGEQVSTLTNPVVIRITFSPDRVRRLAPKKKKFNEEDEEDSGVVIPTAEIGRRARVVVHLSSDGKLIRFVNEASNTDGGQVPNQPIAEALFRSMAGDQASQFTSVTQGDTVKQGIYYAWELQRPWHGVSPGATWRIGITMVGTQVREATLTREFGELFRKESDDHLQVLDALRQSFDILRAVFAIIALAWATGAVLRKLLDYRLAVGLGCYTALAIAFRIYFGSDPTGFGPNLIFSSVMPAIPVVALASVGQLCARLREREQWIDFLTLFRGSVFSRRVGRALLLGLLFAPFVAFLPYAVAHWGPGGEAMLRPFPDPLLERTMLGVQPAMRRLLPTAGPEVLIPLLFLLPLVGRLIGSRLPRYVVQALALAVVFVLNSQFASGMAPAVALAGASALLACLLYHQCGVLTLLAAYSLGPAMRVATTLVNVPSHGLEAAGYQILAFQGVLLIAAIALAARGRKLSDPEIEECFGQGVYLTDRERLRSEFSQAHEAQHRMLPSRPPAISGFSLSAACKPAKDVGGDLYDYFHLADGRLGICVADVSGKGMAAALYMTLTKGVLAAAARQSGNILDLTQHLNTHLHLACRRKMFVTAVLGAIHPGSRTVEMVRAGHNPALLRRAATGETKYLQPKGVGLGLASTRVMGRGLEMLTITLEPGDALVFYSDGITEAMNAHQEQYGEERLMGVVSRAAGLKAHELRERIQVDMAAFVGSTPPHDDATVLVLVCDTPRKQAPGIGAATGT